MISIVVTVYNKESYIKRTLQSILNQTQAPSEIIIINDGSTDKSLEIINKIQLPKFAQIISTKNQGVSAARNLGLKRSKFEYLYFVDGDDLLDINAISIFNSVIINDPNYGLYAANRITEDQKLKVTGIESKDFDLNEYFNQLIRFQNLCWTSAVIVNKRLLGGEKFNENFSHGEDRDFFIRIIRQNKGFWINRIVATYMDDPNGLSAGPIHKNEDLFWLRFRNHYSSNKPNSKLFFYNSKYRFSNILNNLKYLKIKNAISWLI